MRELYILHVIFFNDNGITEIHTPSLSELLPISTRFLSLSIAAGSGATPFAGTFQFGVFFSGILFSTENVC